MIPRNLTLRNFLSYGAEAQTLCFDGMPVLCLSGENGHGKSSLLDAITWALFGKARARTDEELVHHGATEMAVSFDLQLNDTDYRVSRVRTTKGKTSVTLLDLFTYDPAGGWRTLSGNSVRETEQQIERLLGMNYQTFINSAFLLQGRADEFTVKPPAERKRVLADVLNLDVYERLAQRARERRNNWASVVQSCEREIGDLTRALLRLPEAEATLEAARQRRATVDATLPLAEEQLRLLRTAWQNVLRLREERESRVEDRARLGERVERERDEIRQVEERAAVAGRVLTERDAILDAFQQWQRERAREQEQADRLLRLQPLFRRQQDLQKAIDREENTLRQEESGLRGRQLSCGQEAEKQGELEQELSRLKTKLNGLEQASAERETLQCQQLDLREQAATVKAERSHLEQTLDQLRTQYKALETGGAQCPICRQPLSDEQRERLRGELHDEAKQCKAAMQEKATALQQCETEQERVSRALTEAERRLKQRERLKREEAGVQVNLRKAVEAAENFEATQRALAELGKLLMAGEYAVKERQALTETQREVAAVGYDEAAHQSARLALAELASAEGRKRQLDDAEQQRALAAASLRELRRNLRFSEEQAAAAAVRVEAVEKELEGSAETEQRLRTQEQEVRGLRDEQSDAAQAVGSAEKDVEQLRGQQETREQRTKELREAQEQQALYAELLESFGRNGVQAMLIDEAIPLITEEANRLLGAMTDGRLTVALETQKQSQKGTVVETLDIRISDELGTRNYELYSGGEAFRVNFSLRVALSHLLARRAGTRLQTLIIDEGFGSQDTTGRDRLQSVLSAITDDFACIIVITHLDEMKDWFPSRVEVVKDGSGSHLRVIAA